MSIAQWPSGVPYQPLSGNIQMDPYRAPLITEMEDGPTRQRKRGTMNIATMGFTLRMSYTAFAIFKPWLRTTLVDGTLSFEMSVWGSSGAFVTRTCRFVQPPRVVSMQTEYVDIAITLDIENY